MAEETDNPQLPQAETTNATEAAVPVNSVVSQIFAKPEGNLPKAVLLGIAACLLSSIAWAAVTFLTGYQIGFMAIGVGLLVGFAVRIGNGSTNSYRLLGAGLSLVGCILGNVLTIYLYISKEMDSPILDVVQAIPFSMLTDAMGKSFQVIDLLFYGLAIYEAWKFSVRAPEKAAA